MSLRTASPSAVIEDTRWMWMKVERAHTRTSPAMTIAVSVTSGSSGSAPIRSASAAADGRGEALELDVGRGPQRRRALGDLAEAPEQAQGVGLVEVLPPIQRDAAEQAVRTTSPRDSTRPVPDCLGERIGVGLVPVEEHRLLGREVVEHRLLGHVACRGDAGDADGVEALGQEQGRRDVGDPLAQATLLALAQTLDGWASSRACAASRIARIVSALRSVVGSSFIACHSLDETWCADYVLLLH